MPKFETTQHLEIDIAPYDVADLFCKMNETEQALFFNSVAAIVDREFTGTFAMQMQYVTDNATLNLNGRRIMKTIGDYSEKTNP